MFLGVCKWVGFVIYMLLVGDACMNVEHIFMSVICPYVVISTILYV